MEDVLRSMAKWAVWMIGLSFKTGTGDLRESALMLIAEQFIGKGLGLLVYYPEVQLLQQLGANRRFIVPYSRRSDRTCPRKLRA